MIQRGVVCLAVLLAVCLTGCSENSDKSHKEQRVEGFAKEINFEKNVFTMTFKDGKGVERDLSGTVHKDATVLINGKAQSIKDVVPGDPIVVFGHKEGKGEAGAEQTLVATRVEVTRPKESDWKTPGTPAGGTAAAQPKTIPPATQHPTAAVPPSAPTGETPAKPATTSDQELRDATTGAIYAQIRIKMEEAIAERAKMLKEGRPASDPEIRRLEGVIMNARRLLTEAGEIVGEVNPPIVEQPAPAGNAPQQPAATP